MTSTQTKYKEMDLARDPSGQRTAWIIEKLHQRPRRSAELFSLAESNGLGFAKATYVRDLKSLLLKRLIWQDGSRKYGAEPNGVAWMEQHKKDWAA